MYKLDSLGIATAKINKIFCWIFCLGIFPIFAALSSSKLLKNPSPEQKTKTAVCSFFFSPISLIVLILLLIAKCEKVEGTSASVSDQNSFSNQALVQTPVQTPVETPVKTNDTDNSQNPSV